ncbi:dTDP-4-dehydrorhamnose 3,5-epimerase family protein [Pelagibacteraceae bacterium]|nr:dTDP-4-dehydrorhamnose 3,5-epimerase family protein [Pelagibacteraceae bacterium]
MKIINTKFKDLKIIKQDKFKDKRGYLRITYNKKLMKEGFVFDYHTNSKKNSLRGFHFQYKHQQSKYISVIKGKILDCVVDLRKNSKTFGKSFKIILSDKNNLGLFVPKGFAHAYYSYNNENIIYYKLNNYYQPKYEDGVNVLDKQLKIKWPRKFYLISEKDQKLGSLNYFKKKYKYL